MVGLVEFAGVAKAVELFLSLYDRMTKHDKNLFETDIDPLFQNIALIQKNYLDSFNEILQVAKSEDLAPKVKRGKLDELIVNRSTEFEELRMRCQALSEAALRSQDVKFPSEACAFFSACHQYFRLTSGETEPSGSGLLPRLGMFLNVENANGSIDTTVLEETKKWAFDKRQAGFEKFGSMLKQCRFLAQGGEVQQRAFLLLVEFYATAFLDDLRPSYRNVAATYAEARIGLMH